MKNSTETRGSRQTVDTSQNYKLLLRGIGRFSLSLMLLMNAMYSIEKTLSKPFRNLSLRSHVSRYSLPAAERATSRMLLLPNGPRSSRSRPEMSVKISTSLFGGEWKNGYATRNFTSKVTS
jgi:hypothetical protein